MVHEGAICAGLHAHHLEHCWQPIPDGQELLLTCHWLLLDGLHVPWQRVAACSCCTSCCYLHAVCGCSCWQRVSGQLCGRPFFRCREEEVGQRQVIMSLESRESQRRRLRPAATHSEQASPQPGPPRSSRMLFICIFLTASSCNSRERSRLSQPRTSTMRCCRVCCCRVRCCGVLIRALLR